MRRTGMGAMLLSMMAAWSLSGAAAGATAAVSPAAAAASVPVSPQGMPGHPPMTALERNRPKVVDHVVDINSASRKELMTLPGIGAAEADKIIANRPYLTKTELVTKGVLPTGPFLSLKRHVVALQKVPPGKRKAPKAAAAKPAGPQASGPKAQ